MRRTAGGRLDRRRQTIRIASAPAAAVGRVLAGTDAVARAAARSVLVEAAGSEPQRDAVEDVAPRGYPNPNSRRANTQRGSSQPTVTRRVMR